MIGAADERHTSRDCRRREDLPVRVEFPFDRVKCRSAGGVVHARMLRIPAKHRCILGGRNLTDDKNSHKYEYSHGECEFRRHPAINVMEKVMNKQGSGMSV